MIPFQKIIAWFLIGLLSFEVTFRVPLLLPDASALEAADHEDIVSLLVEEDIFRKMSSDIDTYARRIQTKLPHTRTVILTYAKDAHPYLIASANERLYFSGLPNHGQKTQKLVGTILIGHVPIPVVHKDGKDFLSLYPYTDFDEPHFFWNWDTSRYEFVGQKQTDTRPDIWHSVIDPNTGSIETDVSKIRDFFVRVYDYDAKKGQYQNVGVDPQVLYMDSINESRAASKGLLGVYEQISVPAQENLLYHRFTREFSQYLYSGFLSLMQSEGSAKIVPFREWKFDPNSSASFLTQASDITTKVFGDQLITPFIKVINEKYIGDLNRWVHNAGRYYNGYSDVRVDTIPELITTKDAISGQILKEGNDTLEKIIDTYVDTNLSLDIPVLVSRPFQKTILESQNIGGKIRQVSRTYDFVYDNYFYGTKASTIKSASECSLIRGSNFGGLNSTVETNHGYNILGAQDDTKHITNDTDAGIKCLSPSQSYWGGNSPMNSSFTNGEMVLKTHRYDDFSLPVLDLAAGKKTTGANSPLDCLRNDLILRPYQHNGLDNRKYLWPVETGGSRYSCATPLQSNTPNPFFIEPTPETSENILSSLVSCSGASGTITLLNRDGGSLGLCQANGYSGTYKRIPSLVKHSDPSTEVYGKQLQGNSTPNLPVDEERYLLYLDRTGAQSRVDYPNLFDISVDLNDTDDAIISKIRTSLLAAQSHLVSQITLPANHKWSQLVQSRTSSSINLADVILANADIKKGIIEALRWKQLDIEMKYKKVMEIALTPTATNAQLILPAKKNMYEISYLGGQGDARNFVFGFSPEEKSDLPEWFTTIQKNQGEVQTTLGSFSSDLNPEYSLSAEEIGSLLGETTAGDSSAGSSDDSSSADSSDSSSDSECGDPNGVVIWEWLSAIQCWLSNLTKTEWFKPNIDDIGFPELPSLTVSLNGKIVWSTKELKNVQQSDTNSNNVLDYVEKNKDSLVLNNTLSSDTLEPNQTLRIDTSLEDDTYRINDDTTRVQLEVTRIDDLDEKKSYSSRDTDWVKIKDTYFTISGSDTMTDGHTVWIFTSRNNHRSRISFESRIYSGSNVLIRSEKNSVLIGPIILGATVMSSAGTTSGQTLIAGDTAGLNVLLTGLDQYPSTVDITLRDYVTGQEKGTFKSVPVTDDKFRLGSPAIDNVIRSAGRYSMTIIAGDYSGKANFTVVPDKPDHAVLSLPHLLIKDTPESMKAQLLDVWGNAIDLQNWSMAVESSTNISLLPLASQVNHSFNGKAVDSLTLTPIEAGNTTLTVNFSRDEAKIVATISRPVLSDAHLVVDIPNKNLIEVGQEIPLNFSIQRQDGTLVDDWDMSVQIGIRGGDAKISQSTLNFVGGKATTTLRTGTRTGAVSIYVQNSGLGKIVGESFSILPGSPANITLSSPEILYARPGARDILTVRLYDLYGNLTTLHGNTLKLSADKNIIEPLALPHDVTTGVFETDVVSLGYPGRILFRVWLEKDGKKSSLISLENVSQTNALPVITSEEASQNTWQNLTQVLLGAAFGQTPVQGYFGGSTLFAPSTKTLSLSTLIDTPENPVFTVMPNGNINTGSVQYGTGIEVQIESYLDNVLSLLIYDTRLGNIARVRYPSMSNISFNCSTTCAQDSMSFIPASNEISYQDGIVSRNSQKLFSLADVFSYPNLSFAFIHQDSKNLQFALSYNGLYLGILSLQWKARVPSQGQIIVNPKTITVESLRSTLLTKLAWSNMSSYETPSLVAYNAGTQSSYLGGADTEGWSSYPKKSGLGWTNDNVSLLQFASGQEWSSSMRDHADYLTINLGDPIISLPNYDVNGSTGLDQTLGEPVYMSDVDIDDFTFRDTNSDGKKDLIVYHTDGTVGMGLSRGDGSMIDVGDLLSVRNAENGMVRSGDFIGDGYADIVYVDSDGALHQVTHDISGPLEKPMKYDKAPLLGKVEQLEVFDMDHDGIDDIILMDNLGSLYIFYGHSSGIFRTQLLDNVYDFVLSDEAKSSYFTGAVRYSGLGFVDPSALPKATSFELQSKQDQVNQALFTQIRLARSGSSVKVDTLGSAVTNSIAGNQNGFLGMYDGDATTLASSLQFGYDSLANDSANIVSVERGDTTQYDSYNLLRAPFIIPGYLSITKQYKSLEASGQILAGSPIEVNIVLKNVSKKNMSNIMLLEKFADYLSVTDMKYDLVQGTKKETRSFLEDSSQSNSGIADLRDVSLAPGASLILVYSGTLRAFSFGQFDVGYLEDKNDPTSKASIEKDKIRTINTSALKLDSIPEADFYNHDVYGDIRFNPNETCGGPLLLWRSHNTYDRTYHKTIIVRDIADPDKNASALSQDPTDAFSGSVSSSTSGASSTPNAEDILASSQSELATWQTDSDGDSIPDKDDNDHGDVFEVSSSGNSTQVSIGLGKIDETVDDIVKGVKDVLSGLSCGFGDPGCISMPINWAANIPGNTVTVLGYAVPGLNQPPIACHKDVRCGYPVFAYPTICSTTGYPTCTWPSDSEGAGGAFDYFGGSGATGGNGLNDAPNAGGSVSAVSAGSYMPGVGISEYRLFIGATLTGAIAEVFCFGPNNAISNVPGMFPLRFDGNCIFATQPLFQCSDDGSSDEPLDVELDISDELADDSSGDGSDSANGSNGNRFTNADNCGFFEPTESYPSDLSQATSAYFSQTNDTTTTALQDSISANAALINNSSSSDTALGFSTSSPSAAYDRLNGTNGLSYKSGNGSGMIQISLNPDAMKFKDFGKVLDINLKSIKGFPNFIMDWYQRQMDEIMSSLTHLPDLKIYLPDLSSLADKGWISGFGSGLKDTLGNIVSSPVDNQGNPVQNTGNASIGNSDLNFAQSNAINSATQVPTKYGTLQCGEFANNYIESLTGVQNGPINDSFASKKSLINSNTPVAGSVAMIDTGADFGHAAVVTKVNNNGTVDVIEANYYSPGAIGTRKNVPTIGIAGYYVPSSNSTSTSSANTSNSSSGNILTKTADTVSSGWNGAFDGVGSGLDTLGTGAANILGGVENAADAVGSVVQQKTAGIQNAFEYLGTLPIINVHPESINFEIPWVGKQEAQAWILRNEAILDAWQHLPKDAVNSVSFGPFISSIQSNIETVKTYLELPERLQTLFYLKEKLLYGIVQNVKAVQDLMGGWLYNNGLRFKGWVEAFILITKLFDLWQVLLDVFNDYEVECGECRNERWNLQHWLWIIISAIIPPIPIIQMPRWPDIELDFSDIDLSLNIAYPVFNLNFYPVALPDAPAPSISGFAFDPMPQLPQLPNLNIDINIPVIQLPKLPDLPPPPKIPELSQAITVVLKIFKLLVLIQCLYRKIPLSPEWVVGTKVAHKTERQGYLPFDFLDSRLPTVTMDWLEAIRVSSHVKLNYNVDFVVDALRDALEPFTNFPRNLDRLSGGTTKSVNIDVKPDTGVQVQTSVTNIVPEDAIVQIPELIRELFTITNNVEMVDPNAAIDRFSEMVQGIDISPERRTQLASLINSNASILSDISPVQQKMNERFDQIAAAVQLDITENSRVIDDLNSWSHGSKKPENIALLAPKIPGVHLAEADKNTQGHLLALNSALLNPIADVGSISLVPFVSPVTVSPVAKPVVAPSARTTFENMVEDTKITKTRGLYVSHGNTTQRLIDYTEKLDGSTKIHTLDDDRDGDLDVYYSLGRVIYRKTNYTKKPSPYIIKDAPRVYTTSDIFEDFFGVQNSVLSSVSGDGQIILIQNHTSNRVKYQSLMKNGTEHMRLRLYRSLFKTDSKETRYQVDILPEKKEASNNTTVVPVPYIADIDGLVFVEHNMIYRRLLTGGEYVNEAGNVEKLSPDFVIRSGQSGYTSESSSVDVTANGTTTTYKIAAGQRITFGADSHVLVTKGSLILFGNTIEKRALTIRDTHMPLLPGDLIITDKNGAISLTFPDGTSTNVGASQYWTLTEYVPGIGVKKLSLPVEAKWYYGAIMDARNMEENRLPHATVFDAYTEFSQSDTVSQIPRQITLTLPSPTEIDFQSYFPADTLTNVEIFRLPSSQYRRVSATKIAFESQKTSTEILVRVTAGSRVRDYTTTILTVPPRLSIDTLNQDGELTGEVLSAPNSLPLGIQSYIGGKSWLLSSGFSNGEENSFSTSVVRNSSKISINQGANTLTTFDRTSGIPIVSDENSLTPNITVGESFSYSFQKNGGEKLKVQYDYPVTTYRQVASFSEVIGSGIFVLGNGLRLEPATLTDTNLLGGAYITDTSYRPLLTLDSQGIIRTLDTNISWTVNIENNHVVFILSKDRKELGRIILNGDVLTNWSGE